MAVGTTASVIRYTVTIGGATSFTFPYAFYDDTDLVVTMYETSGDITVLTQSTDYTISPIYGSYQNGGVVTFVDDDYWEGTLVIQRIVPLLQQTDYQDYSNFPADVFESDLDRLTMMVQQLDEKIGRQLTVPVVDVDPGVEFPVAADRASKFVAFDAEGDVILASGVPEVPVTPFMETLLDDTDAETARATLEVPSLFEEEFTFGSSVTAGDIACSQYDGTPWVIPETTPLEVLPSAFAANVHLVALTSTLLIIVYRDATNINIVAADVAADGTIGTPGSAVNPCAGTVWEYTDISKMADDKFVFAYKKASDNFGYVRVCTVSGTTITMGAESQFAAFNIYGLRCAGLTDSLIVCHYGNASNYAKVRAATVSGTTPTWGTEIDAYSGTTRTLQSYYALTCNKIDSTRFMISAYINALPWIAVEQCSISGSTITAGNPSMLIGNGGVGYFLGRDYNGRTAISMMVSDQENTSNLYYPTYAISVVAADAGVGYPRCHYPQSIELKGLYGTVLFTAVLNDDWLVVICERSRVLAGSTLWAKFVHLSDGDNDVVNDDSLGWVRLITDYTGGGALGEYDCCRLDENRFVLAWTLSGAILQAQVFSLPQFLGFALEAGTTADCQVDGVYRGASGLTAGKLYWINAEGQLTEERGNRSAYVGRAVSSTAIVLGK